MTGRWRLNQNETVPKYFWKALLWTSKYRLLCSSFTTWVFNFLWRKNMGCSNQNHDFKSNFNSKKTWLSTQNTPRNAAAPHWTPLHVMLHNGLQATRLPNVQGHAKLALLCYFHNYYRRSLRVCMVPSTCLFCRHMGRTGAPTLATAEVDVCHLACTLSARNILLPFPTSTTRHKVITTLPGGTTWTKAHKVLVPLCLVLL